MFTLEEVGLTKEVATTLLGLLHILNHFDDNKESHDGKCQYRGSSEHSNGNNNKHSNKNGGPVSGKGGPCNSDCPSGQGKHLPSWQWQPWSWQQPCSSVVPPCPYPC